MVGDLVADRYELEELVGSGGMSNVYRAHDRLLERKVALKILHERFTEDDDYVERFRREARAVASLSHPNIVTVIDRGEEGGRQFIVFEYIEGENLKALLDRDAPMPVRAALEIALQVAGGLAFAHEHGLVHRDVKPQNVLMNDDGQAKVTDFGIARSLDVQHGMTQTGTVLGTSDYIAPEQAQGQSVSEQTDVYSLGVVIYELLTGEVPFPAENFVAAAMRHINEPAPSVLERRPDVPPRLGAAIERAMAKEPGDRFATMSEFAAELRACLVEAEAEAEGGDADPGVTMVVTPTRAPRRAASQRQVWPLVVLVVGLAALVAVAVAVVLASRSGSGSGRSATPGSHRTSLSGVTAYDPPPGDGEEHNAEAGNATDGNPGTFWTTQSYRDGFSGLGKQGVGIVLDAGSAVRLHTVRLSTDTPGFTAEIKAGSNEGGPFPTVVSPSQTVGGAATFPISGDPARYYVIWITRLAGASAHVNEVAAD